MSVEKRERNLEIRNQIKSGKSIREVAKNFGLTHARVSEINYRMRYEEDHYGDNFDEIYKACDILHQPYRMASKLIKRLYWKGYGKQHKWTRLTRDDVLDIHQCGEKSVEIIELAQKLYFEAKSNTITKPQVNEAL